MHDNRWQNSHQKPARPSAPVNGDIFMGLMPENSITIFAENSITFDSGWKLNDRNARKLGDYWQLETLFYGYFSHEFYGVVINIPID